MKKSQYSPEQMGFAMSSAEQGASVLEFCRKMGVSERTYYRWKKK